MHVARDHASHLDDERILGVPLRHLGPKFARNCGPVRRPEPADVLDVGHVRRQAHVLLGDRHIPGIDVVPLELLRDVEDAVDCRARNSQWPHDQLQNSESLLQYTSGINC